MRHVPKHDVLLSMIDCIPCSYKMHDELHRLRIAFTARPKINSHSQIFRPKHILSAQIFIFLWFMPSLGVHRPWWFAWLYNQIKDMALQAFDLKISWSHTHNNHHIFGRGIWEKEIVSAKCHTKQLWVYMYVSIQQYKRIGMWAAVIWIDEDMKNLESTLLATSLYIWLPNQHTGLNERTKKTILFIANQLIRVAAESKSCDVTQWKFIFVAGQKLKKQSFEVRSFNHSGIFFIFRWSLNHCAPPLAWQVSTGSKWFRDHL